MRPNPRWQQQGGRGQGEPVAHDASVFNIINIRIRLKCTSWINWSYYFLSLPGGFQGIPSSLRQPGPRGNLRHMAPGSNSQGPRGVFTVTMNIISSLIGFGTLLILLNVFSLLLASGQSMAPRPSMGVPGPRAMPPYKYATGVRNPNPQVVQPIALQQVPHHLPAILSPQTYEYFSLLWPLSANFRLSRLCTFRARSLSLPPCWLLHPPRSRNRC